MCYIVFFFKPKTAYEMRISDWSSDVCSSDLLKWKVAPQDAFLKQWEPAKDAWARGQKVVRLIGYDASPADTRRYTHASTITSDLFECRYPLREWGWDRAACIARIEAAQLPVPPKSSCFICGAMKPDEVRALPSWCLRLIVLVRSEEHTSELQSLMRTTYAVFCL